MKSRIFAAAFVIFLLPGAVFAEFYRYVDGKGTVCVTNERASIPKKYLSTVTVVRPGKDEPRPAPSASRPAPSAPGAVPASPPSPAPASVSAPQVDASPAPEVSGVDGIFARYRWAKPAAIVAGIIAGLFVFITLLSHLPSGKMGRVICIVFFLGIFTFLYKVYADYVTASFFTIKEKAVTMFKKANVREMPEGGSLPAADGK